MVPTTTSALHVFEKEKHVSTVEEKHASTVSVTDSPLSTAPPLQHINTVDTSPAVTTTATFRSVPVDFVVPPLPRYTPKSLHTVSSTATNLTRNTLQAHTLQWSAAALQLLVYGTDSTSGFRVSSNSYTHTYTCMHHYVLTPVCLH
jgi:hypothetical protein